MKDFNKQRLIYVITIIFILLSIFILLGNRKNDVKLDDVIVKENISNKKEFAVMLQDEAGSDSYTPSVSNTFPVEGYTFNSEKSGCMDSKGYKIDGALSYDSTNQKVLLSLKGEANCYVYFDVEVVSVPSITSVTLSTLDNDMSTKITDIVFSEQVSISKYYLTINNFTFEYDTLNSTATNIVDYHECYSANTTYNYEVYAITTNGVRTESYNGSITSGKIVSPCVNENPIVID